MHSLPTSVVSPGQAMSLIWQHPRHWLLPAVAVAVLAGLYALVRPDTWEASQALVLRDEAANSGETPGKFAHADEMKTAQETVLELVRSRGVLAAALAEVGPPETYRGDEASWPRPIDVGELRDAVRVAPPKGAEFGRTEVFYLKVRHGDRARAESLVAALSRQLEAGYQELRNAKAQSMIDELGKAVRLAKGDLADSTARLSGLEKQVGSDLAELRMLHESSSGESALRRTTAEIRSELRQVRGAQKAHEELLALLARSQQAQEGPVALPGALLESQPALRRLKEGLVDAQLRAAELQGRRSADHPLVLAAKEAEAEIGAHLRDELASAGRAIAVDMQLAVDRAAFLESQLAETTERLDRLAGLRADYANLVAETRNRSGLVERAEQKLAEARIAQATSQAASLIGRIDAPDSGVNPIGPSRLLIALAGLVGGLATGVGAVFLTMTPTTLPEAKPSETPSRVRPPRVNGRTNGFSHGPVNGVRLTLAQALNRLNRGT